MLNLSALYVNFKKLFLEIRLLAISSISTKSNVQVSISLCHLYYYFAPFCDWLKHWFNKNHPKTFLQTSGNSTVALINRSFIDSDNLQNLNFAHQIRSLLVTGIDLINVPYKSSFKFFSLEYFEIFSCDIRIQISWF